MSSPAAQQEPSPAILDAAQRWLAAARGPLGPDFVAACLTGGVLAAGFDPRHSHVNVLVVAEALASATIGALAVALPHARSGPRFDPLFVTRAELMDSLDVFPIEWSDVRERHRLLAGEDLFATLAIAPEALRAQLEHELRSKHLRLRMFYFGHAARPSELRHALAASASGFHAAFRGLLRLRGETPPAEHLAALDRVAAVHALDAGSLRGPHLLRYAARRIGDDEAREIYRRFLGELERLVNAVDGWKAT